MNSKILLLALSAAALSSCSTMYKTGQTPDDVYYSPSRNNVAARVEKNTEEPAEAPDYLSYEDRQIRMGIENARWRYLNYDVYSYNPYSYGYNYGYYYNPYYYPYPVYNPIFIAPANPVTIVPRKTNLNSYNNSNYSNTNTNVRSSSIRISGVKPVKTYNNSNSAAARGYTPPSYNNSNSSYTPQSNSSTNNNNTYTPPSNSNSGSNSRSYTPSSSGSSSSGSRPRANR